MKFLKTVPADKKSKQRPGFFSAMHSLDFPFNGGHLATFRPSCADRVLAVREEPVTSMTCVTTPLEKTVIALIAGYDDPPHNRLVAWLQVVAFFLLLKSRQVLS